MCAPGAGCTLNFGHCNIYDTNLCITISILTSEKISYSPPPPSPSPCACCPAHPCSLSPAPTHVYTDTTLSQVEGAGGEQLAVRLIDSWSSSGRPQTGGGAGYRPGHYSHHTTTHSGSSPSGGSFFSHLQCPLYTPLLEQKNGLELLEERASVVLPDLLSVRVIVQLII